jgi:hypothetical protein
MTTRSAKQPKDPTPTKLWAPMPCQVYRALEHVAWEYYMLIASAFAVASGPSETIREPTNHMVQEVFLVHFRNLAEFFCMGVDEFRATGTAPRRAKAHDNIYAVDFCTEVGWQEDGFRRDTQLRVAINKTLSHMTYSRDLKGKQISKAFDGRYHVHGTMKLFLRTWQKFVTCLKPGYEVELDRWIKHHSRNLDISVEEMISAFECLARKHAQSNTWRWQLDTTPEGPV